MLVVNVELNNQGALIPCFKYDIYGLIHNKSLNLNELDIYSLNVLKINQGWVIIIYAIPQILEPCYKIKDNMLYRTLD